MSAIFKKLNLSTQAEILVVNAPASFEPELASLSVSILRDPEAAGAIHFALAFVTKQTELNALARSITSKAEGDAIIWFAYPKKSSKRYRCEFNRDSGWGALGEAGYEGVRQVAIDEDWSALRFRRTEFIKTLRRNPAIAMSELGKKRTAKGDGQQ
jgi:hypothetical protein